MDPFFIVETALSFEQASSSLEAAVTGHGFGVLGIHDIGQILRSKGMPFKEQCRILRCVIQNRQIRYSTSK